MKMLSLLRGAGRPLWVSRALLAIPLLLSACASGPQSLIVGTWEMESGMKVTWQLRKDGTGSMTMMGKTAEGKYRFNGQDELELIAGADVTKLKVNVSDQELQVISDGHVTKFRRKR
jgi:hypothetical protein